MPIPYGHEYVYMPTWKRVWIYKNDRVTVYDREGNVLMDMTHWLFAVMFERGYLREVSQT